MKTNWTIGKKTLTASVVAMISFAGSLVDAAITGTGTESDPYVISSKSDFLEFAGNTATKNYEGEFIRLDTAIDLSAGFTALIGLDALPFKGNFDGNGNTISNSTIGLFHTINSVGSVKNLQLDGFNITASSTIGCLVAVNYGLVESCRVTNSKITNSGAALTSTGGLVGENNGTIRYCLFEASAKDGIVAFGCVGGLVGRNTAFILNSKTSMKSGVIVNPAISKDDNSAVLGGFVGCNTLNGFIDNCWSDLVPNTNNGVSGGFAGRTEAGSIISNSISAGIMPADVGQGSYAGFTGDALQYSSGRNNFVPNDIGAQKIERGNHTGHTDIVERTRAYLYSSEFVVECNLGGGNWGLDENGNATPVGIGMTSYVPYSFLKGDILPFNAAKDFGLDSFFYVKKLNGSYLDPWKVDKKGQPLVRNVPMPLKKYTKVKKPEPVVVNDSGYVTVKKHISLINRPALKRALKETLWYSYVLEDDITTREIQKEHVKVTIQAVLPGKKNYSVDSTIRYVVPPRIDGQFRVVSVSGEKKTPAYVVVRIYDGGLKPKCYIQHQLESDGAVITKSAKLIPEAKYATLPAEVLVQITALTKENDPDNVRVRVFKLNSASQKAYDEAYRYDVVIDNNLGVATATMPPK